MTAISIRTIGQQAHWLGPALLFAIAIVAVIMVPDKWQRRGWDQAIVLKICPGGIPVVRLPDGQVWARVRWNMRYPVDDAGKVCP